MDDVVLHALGRDDQVAQQPSVGRRDGADGVFDGADRGDRVHRRADAADALREGPGVARVAALQDHLDAAEHRGRGPGVLDLVPVHLRLDPQVALDAGDGIDDDVGHGRSPFSRRLLGRFGQVAGRPPLFTVLPIEISPCAAKAAPTPSVAPAAHPVDSGRTSETGNALRVLIEGRHRVPEVGLGAADARMSAADRPVRPAVPADHRTVLEGHRALAAHLVEAVAGAVRFVAPDLDVLAGVVVGAPLAVVVDRLAVGEKGARYGSRAAALERQVVDDEGREVLDVGGTGRRG